MSVREDQLNGRIATIIRECVQGTRWTIAEENDGTLATSSRRPDILITRPIPEPPVVIENEYNVANLEADCLNKLGLALQPVLGGQTIYTVIGLHSPKELQDAANGDVAEAMLRNGAPLQYAAYMGTPEDYTRFPKSGFITGDVRNLVEFVRPAAEPADLIRQAADALANGAVVAARAIVDAAALNTSIGVNIAEKLRQPWPTGDSDDPKQAKADQEARLQTANMATTMIINAMAYQQNLDGYSGIKGLAQVRDETARKRLTKDAVIAGFDQILDVNFWPIFHVAKELLLQIPASTANNILEQMADAADGIIEAARHNDIAGTVFQRLIADRKTLKTYYTTPEATTLLTHLAIPENLDWGDPETLKRYRIADYACGSGGIMLASYQRVRDLHRLHGGHPDALHEHMMKDCLTACDIMPAAVHLTASLLSSVSPTAAYESTRCILFPFGGQRKTDRNGQLVLHDDGNPVKVTDAKGRPVVNLGSMVLLNLSGPRVQTVLPLDEQAALSARGERRGLDVIMVPGSESLVAMNPPFTRPTKHAPFGTTDHVEPKNPAFAAFGTTDEEQSAMKSLANRLGKNTISDGNAGLGTTFMAIANNMVRRGGHIALILPTSAEDTYNRVEIGGEEIGFVYYENVAQNRKWTTMRIAEPTLVERAKKLAQGELRLPQRAEAIEIPMVVAGCIAQVGPVDRDINGRNNSPFSKRSGYKSTDEYPMLWNHDKKRQGTQNRMLVKPDSHGEVRQNQTNTAQQMWDNAATHLHVNRHFQFNANATAAAFTERPSLGGAEWPTLTAGSPQQEKALCVWLNGTLGMLNYWIASNRRQDGRGQITITFVPNIPVLDVTKLRAAQLDAAVRIFDDLQDRILLPANEAWRDPVRKELDRRLLNEVLGLDDKAVEQLSLLRRQWCNEPTVTSAKETGPPD